MISFAKVLGVSHGILIFLIYLFLLSPLIMIAMLSFNSTPSLSFPLDGFSFRWYLKLFSYEKFIEGFKVSFVVALVVSAFDFCIGISVAYVIDRFEFHGKAIISGLFLAPLLVPTIVLGLALLLILSPFYLTGTYLGIVIAHFGITVPYVVRTTLASMQTVDTSCEEAARILGAGPFTVFRRVTLPIIVPGAISGVVMAFIISFDEAVISLFVAASNHVTLPVVMFRYIEFGADPLIAALSFVLILIALVTVVVIERLTGLKGALK